MELTALLLGSSVLIFNMTEMMIIQKEQAPADHIKIVRRPARSMKKYGSHDSAKYWRPRASAMIKLVCLDRPMLASKVVGR